MYYAETMIRGIRKKDWIVPLTRKVSSYAFEPTYQGVRAWETSIDWEDDLDALPAALSKPTAANGVVRLAKSHVDSVAGYAGIANQLEYERKALADNKYHGNLLFLAKEKPYRLMIAGALALNASNVIVATGREQLD